MVNDLFKFKDYCIKYDPGIILVLKDCIENALNWITVQEQGKTSPGYPGYYTDDCEQNKRVIHMLLNEYPLILLNKG